MNKRIIVSGRSGTGKSTIASILNEKFGFKIINVGDVLYNYLLQNGIKCNNRLDIGPTFLKYHPQEDIFELLSKSSEYNSDIVLDGVRMATTCMQFRNFLPDCKIWYIDAEPKLRKHRLLNKNPELHESNYIRLQKFILDDCDDALIRKISDFTLENNQSIQKLKTRVTTLIQSMEKANQIQII